MVCCSHIWAGTDQSKLTDFERVETHLCGLVAEDLFSTLQFLSHRHNIGHLNQKEAIEISRTYKKAR